MIRGAIGGVVVEFIFQIILPLVGEETAHDIGPADMLLCMDELLDSRAGVDVFHVADREGGPPARRRQ